jgi:hypothetical protein
MTRWVSGIEREVRELNRTDRPVFGYRNTATLLGLPGRRAVYTSGIGTAGQWIDDGEQDMDLTLNGNPVHTFDRLIPQWEYDGVGDYHSHADNAVFDILGNEAYVKADAQGIAVLAWVKFDNAAGALEGVVSKWGIAPQQSYRLYRSAAGDAVFEIYDGGGAARTTTLVGGFLTAAQWYCAIGVLDRDGNSLDIYVGSQGPLQVNGLVVPAGTVITNSNATFEIGSGSTGGGALMTGKVSEAGVYVEGFSSTVAAAAFQQTRGMFGV